MKKFLFALDKVLNYKEQVEANLRTEYAQIMQKVAKEEEKLKKLEAEHRACRVQYEAEKQRGSTIRELKMYEGYLDSVLKKIQHTQTVIEMLKQEEEKKRQEVIEAKTETSSIDKLKGRRRDEYTAAVRKEEEQFIEEFVANTNSGKPKSV